MIEFFQNIGEFFKTVIHGIIVSFTYLPRFFAGVTASIGHLLSLVNMLPDFILHLSLIVLLCAFVFLILRIFHG